MKFLGCHLKVNEPEKFTTSIYRKKTQISICILIWLIVNVWKVYLFWYWQSELKIYVATTLSVRGKRDRFCSLRQSFYKTRLQRERCQDDIRMNRSISQLPSGFRTD